MSGFKYKEDMIRYLLAERRKIRASKEARDKSLLAFQKGLNNRARMSQVRQKSLTFLTQFISIFAGAAVFVISVLLFLNNGILDTAGQGEGKEDKSVVQNNKENKVENYSYSSSNILEKLLNSTTINDTELNSMPTQSIFDEKLVAHLPKDWTVYEDKSVNQYLIRMVGSQGERMNLMLLNKDYSQEEFDARLSEMTAKFNGIEEITIPVDKLIDKIRINTELTLPHKNVFPFDTENAKISAFIDKEDGKLMELYISELFGQPMIFTSELPLNDAESWKLPIIFFTYMDVGITPYTIHGSEGELHPEFGRPTEKSVVLKIGALGIERVEVELYENRELGMTSYLPNNTEVQRIDHDFFTEWRFTEPNVSENSYYSFGKLKEGFPLENAKDIMFEAFNIDLKYHENLGGVESHFYAYNSGRNEEFINGYFQLFEVSGEWYYKQEHSDRNDYNGGVYSQRLEMFINSIEWY